MSFLGPGEEVACAWDELDNLVSTLRKRGHHEGILVRVRYADLAGESYETGLMINPLIYEGNRHVPPQNHQALENLLTALRQGVENTSREAPKGTGRRNLGNGRH